MGVFHGVVSALTVAIRMPKYKLLMLRTLQRRPPPSYAVQNHQNGRKEPVGHAAAEMALLMLSSLCCYSDPVEGS